MRYYSRLGFTPYINFDNMEVAVRNLGDCITVYLRNLKFFLRHARNSRSCITGFTLIELLVVISIITLLASVVLVSVNGARKKSFRSKIIVQLDEIQKAANLYLSGIGQDKNFPPDSVSDFGSFVIPVFSCKQGGPFAPTRYRWTNYGSDYGGSGGVSGSCVGIGLIEGPSGWTVWGWVFESTPEAGGCWVQGGGSAWPTKAQLVDYIVDRCF